MTTLLKLLALDLGRFLWRGLVISGMCQSPCLYAEYRAEARSADILRLLDGDRPHRS